MSNVDPHRSGLVLALALAVSATSPDARATKCADNSPVVETLYLEIVEVRVDGVLQPSTGYPPLALAPGLDGQDPDLTADGVRRFRLRAPSESCTATPPAGLDCQVDGDTCRYPSGEATCVTICRAGKWAACK